MWEPHYGVLRLHFRSVYDLLPSPTNLHRWGLVKDPRCHLCDKPGTMQHDLSSCQPTLGQGRYRWRYDNVLRELADFLERERRDTLSKRHVQRSTVLRKVRQARKQQGPNNINPGWIWLLVDESWPRETVCFSKHHPHRTYTRHSYMVTKSQETDDVGADGPLWDKMWGSIWTKDGKVH